MKRGLIIGVLTAGTAFAGTASIVSSFKSLSPQVYGIDYHGGYLYHTSSRDAIYKTTTTGSLAEKIPTRYIEYGVDRTGTEFWTTGVGINIYRLSTTGTLIRSINAPERGRDIAFGDGFLWHVASNIYKLTTNGSFVSSFSFSGRNLRGICWAAPYLWLADVGKNQVFQMTTQGSIVDYFPIPHQPYGVTCEGAYVWYSVTSNQHAYKMYPYSTNAIAPVSLGKVKALYR